MKGPYGRLRFDVRRLWQCPSCRRFERTGGEVVNLVCRACRGTAEVWMNLVEGAPDGPGGPAPETKNAGEGA